MLGARTPTPPSAQPLLNVRVLVRGVLRHRWWILLVWIVGSALGLAFAYVYLEPKYEAVSIIQVDPVVSNPFTTQHVGGGRDGTFLETQRQLITSGNTLLAAAEDPKIVGFPIIRESTDVLMALRRALDVRIVPNSSLIQVSMRSRNSEEAAAVVNAVVNAYLKADAERSANVNRQQIDRLTEFSKQLKAQVEERRKAWLELAARGNAEPIPPPTMATGAEGSGATVTRQSVTIEEYGKIREQLVTVNIDLAEAEARLENLQRRDRDRQRTEAMAASRAAPEAGASSLEQQLAWRLREDGDLYALRAEYEELERKVTSASRVSRQPANEPAVKLLKARQREIVDRYHQLYQEKLDQLRLLAEQRSMSGTLVAGDPTATPLDEAMAQVGALQATKRKLDSMLAQLDVVNRQQGTDAVQASFIEADLEQIRGMLTAVENRLEVLRYETRGQSRIVLIDEARATKAPESDKRPKVLAAVPFFVLFSVLGAFTALEVRSRRVDRPEDLSRWAQAEVFAIPELPQLQLASSSGLLARRRRRSPDEVIEEFAHRIDHLRVALCGDAVETGWGRCMMISSAVTGEGKTTLSAQLGARCADSGLSTVLIDADLRWAALGRVFDIADAPGLSDVLAGEQTLEQVLIDLPQIGGCKLLAAGTPVENPGRLLQGAQLRTTIERLRRGFDVVIIDTPPLLPVPDGLVLGRWTDGVILATRHDESRLPLLERARQLLQNAGLPLLGIALNGARPSAGSAYANYAFQYRSRQASAASDG